MSRPKSYGRFIMQVRTGLKWTSEANFLDPYSEWVILGFQACPNNRPNGILLDPPVKSREKTEGHVARSPRALSRVLPLELKGHLDCRM
jgi:hypothetical protein